MKTVRCLLLCSALSGVFSGAVMAQPAESDTDAFDGKWSVQLPADGKTSTTASAVIANFGGSWQDLSRGGRAQRTKRNPCSGKKFPVTVQSSTAVGLEFTVWGSAVSPACPDLSVAVKPVDENTLEGSVDAGAAIRMTRPATPQKAPLSGRSRSPGSR